MFVGKAVVAETDDVDQLDIDALAGSPNPSTSPALSSSYKRLIVAAWSIESSFAADDRILGDSSW